MSSWDEALEEFRRKTADLSDEEVDREIEELVQQVRRERRPLPYRTFVTATNDGVTVNVEPVDG